MSLRCETIFSTVRMTCLGATVCALLLTGCQLQPAETAVTGAVPSDSVPVGPLPGPVVLPPLNDNPFHNDAVARTQGRRLFVQFNCSGCHGGHAGGGMGPSLRDADWIYGNSDAHIFDTIAQGRGKGMPSWGRMIPEKEIWQLVADIQSLNTPDEPDAPSEK